MMGTGVCLDSVVNTHIVLVFFQDIVSIEIKPWTEVTLYKSNYM